MSTRWIWCQGLKQIITHVLTLQHAYYCFSWDVFVGVLGDIVCDRRRPVFDQIHQVGKPRVVELRLSCHSCNDDVKGCICGRVGRDGSDTPRTQKILLVLIGDISRGVGGQIMHLISLRAFMVIFIFTYCMFDLLDFFHCCFSINQPQYTYRDGHIALLHRELVPKGSEETIQSKFCWCIRCHEGRG